MSVNLPSISEALFSEREACKFLGISYAHLRNLHLRGCIAHYRVGERVVYAARHISDFKTQNEQRAVAVAA